MDQVMGLLRQVIPVLAGMALALGWLPVDLVNYIKANSESVLAAIGVIGTAIGGIWSLKANSRSSIIASASAMPEVNSAKLAAAIKDPTLKEVAKDAATATDSGEGGE